VKKHFTFLLLCYTFLANAQQFNWVSTAGYSNQVDLFYGAIEIKKDQLGNSYSFDVVTGDQYVQGNTIPASAVGLNTMIYKFDSRGNYISGNSIGGNFDFCSSEIDEENNLYVLGNAAGSQFVYQNETYNLQQGIFKQVLVKFNSNGELLWFYETGCSGLSNGSFLEYVNGNLYFQSQFTSISAIDTSGTLNNVLPFYYEPHSPQGANTDIPFQGSNHFSNGDILLAGIIRGNVSWIEGDTISSNTTGNSIILTRFSQNFEPIWSKTIPAVQDPNGKYIPVTIDANDHVYLGIEVIGSLNFGGTSLLGTPSIYQAAVVSFNSDGSERWASPIVSGGSVAINAIEVDPFHDLIWCVGLINSTATFGDTSIVIPADQMGNGFLASLNAAGQFEHCFSPESASITEAKSICIPSSEQILVGFRNGSVGPYQWSCINFQNQGGMILASYRIDAFEPLIPNIIVDENILQVNFAGDVQWFLNGLPIDTAQSQIFTALNSGIYSVQLDYAGDCIDPVMSNPISISIENIELTTNSESQLSVFDNKLLILNAPTGSVFNIFAIDGKLIKSGEIHSNYIEVEMLNRGLYILQLQTGNKSNIEKFIVP
jgi:hypothetical protein